MPNKISTLHKIKILKSLKIETEKELAAAADKNVINDLNEKLNLLELDLQKEVQSFTK
ncbi:hypothetical protein [Petroclostridium sp. X23]|uniref:hypothetical protein n=1 Tax=Petroclostridium sp. X23 TaxID=3045146 RepID=UPI0024ACF554|nr:hypothetical protein [Petroclostridium sp. X23]WHH60177.1 hypothetical protein QKW49_05430 [Petroclostridium sp. X23]